MIKVSSNGYNSCTIETIGSDKVIAVEVAAMLISFQKDKPEIIDILTDILDNQLRENKINSECWHCLKYIYFLF